jgi:hypothetical protein
MVLVGSRGRQARRAGGQLHTRLRILWGKETGVLTGEPKTWTLEQELGPPLLPIGVENAWRYSASYWTDGLLSENLQLRRLGITCVSQGQVGSRGP